MPNIVMNSLVSPTKVVTNDAIPNPIVSTHSNITLPSIPVPVSSLGIPLTTMKSEAEAVKSIEMDKMEEKTLSDSDTIDADEEKTVDSKKDVEPMPVEVEDDSVIQMASKIEANITEPDDVTESASESILENLKTEQNSLIVENGKANENGENSENGENIQNNVVEPMECASANSIASPKHNMTTDIVMSESGSVSCSKCFTCECKKQK